MRLSAPQSSVTHLGVGSGDTEGEGRGRAGREESLDSGARLSPCHRPGSAEVSRVKHASVMAVPVKRMEMPIKPYQTLRREGQGYI